MKICKPRQKSFYCWQFNTDRIVTHKLQATNDEDYNEFICKLDDMPHEILHVHEQTGGSYDYRNFHSYYLITPTGKKRLYRDYWIVDKKDSIEVIDNENFVKLYTVK